MPTPWINVSDPSFNGGAKGDGVTDDTDAIQAAIDYCFDPSNWAKPDAGALALVFPAGTYKITRGLWARRLDLDGRTNGFKIVGAAGKATEIVLHASAAEQAILRVTNLNWCHVECLRLRGNGGEVWPEIGLWIDADDHSSGGNFTVVQLAVNAAQEGIRVGRTLKGSSLPACQYLGVQLEDCPRAGVRLIGADSDGQQFFGLHTSNVGTGILMESTYNVHWVGGTVSVSTEEEGKGFYLMRGDGGNLGNGSYSIRNVRVEHGAGLAWFGDAAGVENQQKPINLLVDSVVYASGHELLEGPTRVLHMGNVGSVQLMNCVLRVPDPYFHFEDMRSNRFVGLTLDSCHIVSSTPRAFAHLVQGTQTNGSDNGGVRCHIRNCMVLKSAGEDVPSDRFDDVIFLRTPDDIAAGQWTMLADLGKHPCSVQLLRQLSTAQGLSAGQAISRNLAGRVLIEGGTRQGTVSFENGDEPNTLYNVLGTVASVAGSVPPGARQVSADNLAVDGFNLFLQEPPGQGNSVSVHWMIVRP